MALFLAGMALVIFDFNLSAGGATVGILPDTVGYLLLLLSLEKDGIFRKKRDRKSTRLNSSHPTTSRMPSSA